MFDLLLVSLVEMADGIANSSFEFVVIVAVGPWGRKARSDGPGKHVFAASPYAK